MRSRPSLGKYPAFARIKVKEQLQTVKTSKQRRKQIEEQFENKASEKIRYRMRRTWRTLEQLIMEMTVIAKQQPKEHWNCHRGRRDIARGLLCPHWLDLYAESRWSQTAEVWGIPKTFVGTGWFKAAKQSPVPQEQTSGLKWDGRSAHTVVQKSELLIKVLFVQHSMSFQYFEFCTFWDID